MLKATLKTLLIGVCTIVIVALTACETPPVANSSEYDDAFDTAGNPKPTAKTLRTMGRILVTQGRDREAATVFERIIRENPKYLPAYSDLAEIRMRQGATDAAIQTMRTAVRINRNDPVAQNNLGICLMRGEAYENAAGAFEVAMKADPINPKYRANVAAAKGMAGNYDEALDYYLGGLISQADAHYNVAVLAEAREDYARAADEYILAGNYDETLNVDADLARIEDFLPPDAVPVADETPVEKHNVESYGPQALEGAAVEETPAENSSTDEPVAKKTTDEPVAKKTPAKTTTKKEPVKTATKKPQKKTTAGNRKTTKDSSEPRTPRKAIALENGVEPEDISTSSDDAADNNGNQLPDHIRIIDLE